MTQEAVFCKLSSALRKRLGFSRLVLYSDVFPWRQRAVWPNKNTTGPDGIENKHIARPVVTDVIRALLNIIRASKLQPTACNVNRTTPIPKQPKTP
jgi:hypothetical protein